MTEAWGVRHPGPLGTGDPSLRNPRLNGINLHWGRSGEGDLDKIKLLHIIATLHVGGTEMQLLELCRRMNHDRFDLSLLWYTRAQGSMEQQFSDAGVRVYFQDKFAMPLWRFGLRMRRTVGQIAPDIVHTWLYSGNSWGRWAARACGVRCIVASDRNEIVDQNPIVRLSEKLLAGRTVRLANSQPVACSLYDSYGLPPDHTRIIRNAVQIETCDRDAARAEIRTELGLPPDQKIVLMVARQCLSKNYPMFVRAGQLVCGQREDVTFVGVGRADMSEELEGLIVSLGVSGRVRLVGERSDGHRWRAAADVFCLTSNDEGFPNAVLEAMGAGLPVVCTEFGAARELIENSEVGVLVPLNDEQALGREIFRLLDEEARRTRLGAAARALVQAEYTWDHLVETMETLYAQLLRSKTGQVRGVQEHQGEGDAEPGI